MLDSLCEAVGCGPLVEVMARSSFFVSIGASKSIQRSGLWGGGGGGTS